MIASLAARLSRPGFFHVALLTSLLCNAQSPQPDVLTNIAYGVADGQYLGLDVYEPPSKATLRPAVLMIHGGGWEAGDKANDRAFAMALAKNGFVAISINYRLASPNRNHYPAQIDDAQRAVRWIRANATRYGIDPVRIGAFGHSAGAHLAALLGTTDTRLNTDWDLARYSSRVQCVVDTAGPADFSSPWNPPLSPNGMPLLSILFGKSFEEAPQLYRDASPLAHVDHSSAPFLILHGFEDEMVPVRQSEILAETLKRNGVEAVLIRVHDGHLFQKPENQQLWITETLRFLSSHLRSAQ